MNDIANERVGPMLNPPHPGELIRESMDDVGWNVTETAQHLGCERGTLSRLLNGKAGVSANMALALALEDIGWGTATGCGCRRSTSLRRRAGTGPPQNDLWPVRAERKGVGLTIPINSDFLTSADLG